MSQINFTDCTNLSATEREELFGKAFGLVNVIGYGHEGGVSFTKIVTNGQEVTLVGDPEQALHAYLLAGDMKNAKGSA